MCGGRTVTRSIFVYENNKADHQYLMLARPIGRFLKLQWCCHLVIVARPCRRLH